MSARNRVLPALLVLGLAACAGTRGPSGYLQTADIAQREAHGGWVTLEIWPDRTVEGELIAVHDDSVFVLGGLGLHVAPRTSVRRAILGTYNAAWSRLSAWTLLGTLSTVSHGWGLGLTAPLWIITGSVATSAASQKPLLRVSAGDAPPRAAARWAEFTKYARFPAGLPPTLDRTTLRARWERAAPHER